MREDLSELSPLERVLRVSPRCGFYWAKWRIADEGTPEDNCRGADAVWEVVEVFQNHIADGEPDQFRVSVCGVEMSQSFENFYWGPLPIKKLEPPSDAPASAPERGGAETDEWPPRGTLSHAGRQKLRELSQEGREASPPDPEGWIAWSGGECPVAPETLVDVIVRVDHQHYSREAGTWHWNLNPVGGQITAYRVRPATGKGG